MLRSRSTLLIFRWIGRISTGFTDSSSNVSSTVLSSRGPSTPSASHCYPAIRFDVAVTLLEFISVLYRTSKQSMHDRATVGDGANASANGQTVECPAVICVTRSSASHFCGILGNDAPAGFVVTASITKVVSVDSTGIFRCAVAVHDSRRNERQLRVAQRCSRNDLDHPMSKRTSQVHASQCITLLFRRYPPSGSDATCHFM